MCEIGTKAQGEMMLIFVNLSEWNVASGNKIFLKKLRLKPEDMQQLIPPAEPCWAKLDLRFSLRWFCFIIRKCNSLLSDIPCVTVWICSKKKKKRLGPKWASDVIWRFTSGEIRNNKLLENVLIESLECFSAGLPKSDQKRKNKTTLVWFQAL